MLCLLVSTMPMLFMLCYALSIDHLHASKSSHHDHVSQFMFIGESLHVMTITMLMQFLLWHASYCIFMMVDSCSCHAPLFYSCCSCHSYHVHTSTSFMLTIFMLVPVHIMPCPVRIISCYLLHLLGSGISCSYYCCYDLDHILQDKNVET